MRGLLGQKPGRETGAPWSSEAPWAMQIVAVPPPQPTARVALARSFRPEPRNPQQGLGLAEERHAHIYPRDEYIGRAEFCRDAVCLPVLRVVERAAVPVAESSGL